MKTTLIIGGMHCGACETLLKDVLEETEGVASARVSREKSHAVIEYDEKKVSETTLRKAIENEGYTTR
jgi:copper chaperone CopZ